MIKAMLDEDAILPIRAHDGDAGLDLFARETQIVPAKESAVFDTGVHIDIPKGYAGFVKSKSGLNVKHGLVSDGVVDSGYTGSIKVKLYNLSGLDYKVSKGDKISQLVILPVMLGDAVEVKEFDDSNSTGRGDNGFGSTGK